VWAQKLAEISLLVQHLPCGQQLPAQLCQYSAQLHPGRHVPRDLAHHQCSQLPQQSSHPVSGIYSQPWCNSQSKSSDTTTTLVPDVLARLADPARVSDMTAGHAASTSLMQCPTSHFTTDNPAYLAAPQLPSVVYSYAIQPSRLQPHPAYLPPTIHRTTDNPANPAASQLPSAVHSYAIQASPLQPHPGHPSVDEQRQFKRNDAERRRTCRFQEMFHELDTLLSSRPDLCKAAPLHQISKVLIAVLLH